MKPTSTYQHNSNNFRRFTGLLLLLFTPFLLLAQSALAITGQVIDADDATPLPGVTVLVEGTSSGTVTDLDGNFSLNVAGAETVLIISYIGMEDQRVVVGDRTNIVITLSASDNVLDEIVVVGYGSQKRVNLSGAVDAIQTEQLESRPINNLSQGLQGLVPNFNIINASGEPGGAANFNIRGFTSINGGSPLFVVDGIAFEGTRYNDLLRWYGGNLLEEAPMGLYFPGLGKYDLTGDGVEDIALIALSEDIPMGEARENNSLGVPLIYYRVGTIGGEATVYLENGENGGATVTEVLARTFTEPRDYYRPIPFNETVLNPNLTQPFGWE